MLDLKYRALLEGTKFVEKDEKIRSYSTRAFVGPIYESLADAEFNLAEQLKLARKSGLCSVPLNKGLSFNSCRMTVRSEQDETGRTRFEAKIFGNRIVKGNLQTAMLYASPRMLKDRESAVSFGLKAQMLLEGVGICQQY